ncbi:hypothetical protein CRG98_001739 [Punica granatum]|uniref:Uncharacterized protein n=1 Tax=Punica granatum TaxID=22663 RepID=A0A2I0LB08_PUNGR|nr:hypothetical protein CRG98_001739 [Punica granatum]
MDLPPPKSTIPVNSASPIRDDLFRTELILLRRFCGNRLAIQLDVFARTRTRSQNLKIGVVISSFLLLDLLPLPFRLPYGAPPLPVLLPFLKRKKRQRADHRGRNALAPLTRAELSTLARH